MPNRRHANTWWKKRTHLERQLAVFGIGALFFASVLLVSFIFYSQYGTPGGVCLNQACVKAASLIIDKIDEAVPPCENFYRFACGNFLENAPISEEQSTSSSLTRIKELTNEKLRKLLANPIQENDIGPFQIAKKYYKSCMKNSAIEEDGEFEVHTLFSSLGEWPLLSNIWLESNFNWMNQVKEFRAQGIADNILIQFTVDADLKNSSKRVLKIGGPSFSLPREHLLKGRDDVVVKAYFDFMVDVSLLFGAKDFVASEECMEVLKFEINLAKASSAQTHKKYEAEHLMSFENLTSHFKHLDWEAILEIISDDSLRIKDLTFLVEDPKYFHELHKLLEKTPKRVLANYLIWRAIDDVYVHLPKKFTDRKLRFLNIAKGIQENIPRWKICIEQTTKMLPTILGSLYIRKYFDIDSKHEAHEMSDYITQEFKILLTKADWSDKKMMKKAVAKIERMTRHIGYPEYFLSNIAMEDYFAGLSIVGENAFLKSTLKIQKFNRNKELRKLFQQINKKAWIENLNIIDPKPSYDLRKNTIHLPATLLQDVFFEREQPNFLNFGAVGALLGSKISYGFDSIGSKFNRDGNFDPWWNSTLQQKLNMANQCFTEQYDNFTISDTDLRISGVKHARESMADTSGLKAAYLGYLGWIKMHSPESWLPGLPYSTKQLFWISYAQSWCTKYRPQIFEQEIEAGLLVPAELRVLGPLTNNINFAKDFRCPYGSPMNPIKKCNMW